MISKPSDPNNFFFFLKLKIQIRSKKFEDMKNIKINTVVQFHI